MKSNQRKLLDGQVAIVTGGTVGIGKDTCIALSREGSRVVVVGRNPEHLEQAVSELKDQNSSSDVLPLLLDVRNEEDMEEMVNLTLEKFGKIDILITAAGILRAGGGSLKTLQNMSAEEWDEVIDINLKGVFLANRAVLPTMIRKRKGNIVNISSTSGRKGLAFDTAYCASKFGVIGLTEALFQEMSQYGIRVQALLPGAIETGMWNQNGPLPRPGAILPTERVADMIIGLITLTEDMEFATPIIKPFNTRMGKSL
jgi:3-oxoacyl-[acyl-carrier protein] reductase